MSKILACVCESSLRLSRDSSLTKEIGECACEEKPEKKVFYKKIIFLKPSKDATLINVRVSPELKTEFEKHGEISESTRELIYEYIAKKENISVSKVKERIAGGSVDKSLKEFWKKQKE